ncbi:MAG: FmdB family zinc ribbon protein [Gemmatimonadota bacterium]
MPTYEYQCANGHRFERVQKMSDKPATKCPECGAKASRKISGGQGLIFKGSGFYITDYGKDGKGARKDGEVAAKADAPAAAPAAPAAVAPTATAAPAPKPSGSADPS